MKKRLLHWFFMLISTISFFSRLSRLKKIFQFYSKISQAEIVFFFPFYHLGGAEKAHAQICHCFLDKKCVIIFTRSSDSDFFLANFPANFFKLDLGNPLFQIEKYNLLITSLLRIILNRHPQLRVFGANSVFFYNLIPYLNPQIRKIDLIHAKESGILEYSLPYVKLLVKRIISSNHIRAYLSNLYQSAFISTEMLEKIVYIPNYVEVLPQAPSIQQHPSTFKIIFIGRNAPEKRVHLVLEIAQACVLQGIKVEFSLVGNFENANNSPNIQIIKPISLETNFYQTYQKHQIFILTSKNEGIPLVLMEAMANGLIPICTEVGGIANIISNNENGFLLQNPDNEELVVQQALEYIQKIINDESLYHKLSQNAYAYAQENFKYENFYEAYRKIILDD